MKTMAITQHPLSNTRYRDALLLSWALIIAAALSTMAVMGIITPAAAQSNAADPAHNLAHKFAMEEQRAQAARTHAAQQKAAQRAAEIAAMKAAREAARAAKAEAELKAYRSELLARARREAVARKKAEAAERKAQQRANQARAEAKRLTDLIEQTRREQLAREKEVAKARRLAEQAQNKAERERAATMRATAERKRAQAAAEAARQAAAAERRSRTARRKAKTAREAASRLAELQEMRALELRDLSAKLKKAAAEREARKTVRNAKRKALEPADANAQTAAPAVPEKQDLLGQAERRRLARQKLNRQRLADDERAIRELQHDTTAHQSSDSLSRLPGQDLAGNDNAHRAEEDRNAAELSYYRRLERARETRGNAKTYGRNNSRNDRQNATAAVKRTTGLRVAVLLLMEPGRRGIRRLKKTADPILCSASGCYISRGAREPARYLSRRRALGPGNTLGRRAGQCNHHLGCIYRNVDLGPGVKFLQPIDLKVMRHDRRAKQFLSQTSNCNSDQGELVCSGAFVTNDYVMWIVPEDVAAIAGPQLLQRAVAAGLRKTATSGSYGRSKTSTGFRY